MAERKAKKGQARGADKQRENSAKKPSGRPFAPGNKHAWKPGQSGNPAGRPKSITFSEACRKLLAEIEDKEGQLTVAEELARAAILAAKSGSAQHLKEINDRVEGKSRQPIDLALENPREILAAIIGVKPEELPEPKQDA